MTNMNISIVHYKMIYISFIQHSDYSTVICIYHVVFNAFYRCLDVRRWINVNMLSVYSWRVIIWHSRLPSTDSHWQSVYQVQAECNVLRWEHDRGDEGGALCGRQRENNPKHPINVNVKFTRMFGTWFAEEQIRASFCVLARASPWLDFLVVFTLPSEGARYTPAADLQDSYEPGVKSASR